MSNLKYAIHCAVFLSVILGAYSEITADFKSTGERIVGGQIALYGRFPYQVALISVYNAPAGSVGRVFCSGTVINPLWILTTAECLVNQTAEAIQVLAGATNVLREGTLYEVERVIVHLEFNQLGDYENNIGLIQLRTPLELNGVVEVIPLKRRVVGENVRGLLSGWGKTEVSLNLKKIV